MKFKINFKFVLLFISIMIFFKPLAINSLSELVIIDKIWDVLRIITALIICVYTIKKRTITKACFTIIALQIIFFISTIISGGDLKAFSVQALSIIAFCLLLTNELKKDSLLICKAGFYSLALLIFIHTIMLVINPEGIGYDNVYYNKMYFLASKNGIIKFFMPAIIFGLLMSNIQGNKILKKVWIIIALCISISIFSDSTTSIIGILVTLAFYFIYKLKVLKIDYQKIFITICIIMIICTIIEIFGGFTPILNLFFSTDKMSNYVARISIWNSAVEKISNSVIIGNGMPFNGGHILLNGKYVYAHNGYLELLLYGGIIGFSVFLLILNNFLRIKNNYIDNKSICIAAGIIGFLIMMLTETHIFTLSFWGFFVMYDFFTQESISYLKEKNN